eukprot:763273-Rhodomonas_salina.1
MMHDASRRGACVGGSDGDDWVCVRGAVAGAGGFCGRWRTRSTRHVTSTPGTRPTTPRWPGLRGRWSASRAPGISCTCRRCGGTACSTSRTPRAWPLSSAPSPASLASESPLAQGCAASGIETAGQCCEQPPRSGVLLSSCCSEARAQAETRS